MGIRRQIKENWITRKLPEGGLNSTLFLVCTLLFGTLLYLNDILNAADWMPASTTMVIKHHQYWRLWTALFAHGDLAHILGNLFLFVPFAYFLSRYFSLLLFPVIGFLLGGLINFLVILNLSADSTIIGVSGVVYWMGATWMTLAFFIDRRESLVQRFLKVTGVSIVLFFPTAFLPEVSYLSHFLGYIFGVLTGVFVYFVFHKTFNKAEVMEEINEDEEVFDWENFSTDNFLFKPMVSHDLDMFHGWLKREHVAKNWRGIISSNPFIVYHKEKPLGFIQSYVPENFPEGVLQIDQFIADKKLLGKGIGSTFIKKFTDELLKKENIKLIISNPLQTNKPAIRAYRKAGFSRLENRNTPEGIVVFMAQKKEENIPSFYP